MDEQALRDIVDNEMGNHEPAVNTTRDFDFNLVSCPKCGGRIVLTRYGYTCINCEDIKRL